MKITSAEFFADWKFKLSHDFEVGGEPAIFSQEHPKQWGSEEIHIQPPVNDNAPDERLVTRSPPIAVTDDGTLLAVGVGTDIIIYDISAATIHQTIRCAHFGSVRLMQFQPGSNTILAVSSSSPSARSANGIVWVWDLERERSHPRSLPDDIDTAVKQGSLAILSAMEDWPKDSTLSSELEKRIKPMLLAVQNELDTKEGRAHRGRLLGFGTEGFSHDGTYILFEEKRNEVAILDVKSARIKCRLIGHTDAIMWAGSSPDDTLIGTSSWDQTVRLWNAETGEHLRILVGAQGQSWAGAFSPDGKLIAAGCGDKRVRVWAVESGGLLHTFEGYTNWIRSLAFSPDNQKLAAGASGGTLRVFDLATGACLQQWQTQSDNRFSGSFIEVTSALYTSRGLLVFKLTDGRVFTYDEKTNQKGQYEHDVQTEGAPGGKPFSVSRDGARLFASCFDGTIRIWAL
ncbi:hypothetical protein VNI00_015667 [Paramarasmius palmivorus]|uniref:WD40 repeat-like protein n=1 Tax=Paramarasmius palmivorus TaxID=297713 RepID=A0AAW0BL24_9AGAR